MQPEPALCQRRRIKPGKPSMPCQIKLGKGDSLWLTISPVRERECNRMERIVILDPSVGDLHERVDLEARRLRPIRRDWSRGRRDVLRVGQ